jgi:adenylate cyclase, class 2
VIEVELKAHLRDRAAALATVASFARPAGKVDKRDAYWHGSDWRLNRGTRGFRLRSERAGEGGSSVVTYKTKRAEGGIEINREREFEVSDSGAFVEFALRLGCEPFFNKRKTGYAFKVGGREARPSETKPGEAWLEEATIEIIEVAGLGDFIEIEVLLEDEDPGRIALAQGEVRALLARSGVSEADIESRFYSELLIEAGLVKASP